jgi:AcrR family transcriptional regulator
MQELLNSDEIGLRDRKKRRTRQAIRAAAIELFTAQGVDATTIDQIASAADISPRTFFNYFDSKEQAVSLPYGLRNDPAIPSVNRPDKPGGTDEAWSAISQSCLALAAVLEADETERATLIAGVRLCQREPILRDQASAQRGQWEALMIAALDPTLNNRVRVNAAAGAVWASLTDWAEHSGAGSLTDRVQRSLQSLR